MGKLRYGRHKSTPQSSRQRINPFWSLRFQKDLAAVEWLKHQYFAGVHFPRWWVIGGNSSKKSPLIVHFNPSLFFLFCQIESCTMHNLKWFCIWRCVMLIEAFGTVKTPPGWKTRSVDLVPWLEEYSLNFNLCGARKLWQFISGEAIVALSTEEPPWKL